MHPSSPGDHATKFAQAIAEARQHPATDYHVEVRTDDAPPAPAANDLST